MTPVPAGRPETRAARRALLQAAVAQVALAISRGEVTLTRLDLDALALLCDDYQLPVEAARVRRWLA